MPGKVWRKRVSRDGLDGYDLNWKMFWLGEVGREFREECYRDRSVPKTAPVTLSYCYYRETGKPCDMGDEWTYVIITARAVW